MKHRIWISFFSIWLLLLSGMTSDLFGSPPGMIQALRLYSLLKEKKEKFRLLEDENRKLEIDVSHLTSDPIIQEREIRRRLGYAASDELVFDFSSDSP